MQEISANFNFVKSINWHEAANVVTGDVTWFIMLLLMVLVGVAGIMFVGSKRRSVAGQHVNLNNGCLFSCNINFSKFSIAIVFATVSLLVSLCTFDVNKVIANAESTESLCSMDNIKVSVLDTGIEKVDSAILVNNSDVPVNVDKFKILPIEESVANSKWKIVYNGQELYNGFPGETETVLNPPLKFSSSEAFKFDIEISMDAATAISLIDKSVAKLCFSVINSHQEEAYKVLEDINNKFISSLGNLNNLTESEKNDLVSQAQGLYLAAYEQINQLSSKVEIQNVVDAYIGEVLSLLKSSSSTNNERTSNSLKDFLQSCHNIKKTDKNTFEASISELKSEVDENIGTCTDIDSVNDANINGNNKWAELNHDIQNKDNDSSWTVIFNTDGGTPILLPVNVKYGEVVDKPSTELTKEGYTLSDNWLYENSPGNFVSWNFATDKVGETAGDVDACSLTLYARLTAINYIIKFDKNKPQSATSDVQGSMANMDMTYDVPEDLTINAYTLTDWIFVGWNTESSGTGTAYTDGEQVENLSSTDGAEVTLYAQWLDAKPLTVDGYRCFPVVTQFTDAIFYDASGAVIRPADTDKGYEMSDLANAQYYKALSGPFSFTAVRSISTGYDSVYGFWYPEFGPHEVRESWATANLKTGETVEKLTTSYPPSDEEPSIDGLGLNDIWNTYTSVGFARDSKFWSCVTTNSGYAYAWMCNVGWNSFPQEGFANCNLCISRVFN